MPFSIISCAVLPVRTAVQVAGPPAATSVEAMRNNPDMVAYFPKIAAIAALDSLVGHVVFSHHA